MNKFNLIVILLSLLSLTVQSKELTETQKQEAREAFKNKIMESMSADHTLVDKGQNHAVFEKKEKDRIHKIPEKILAINIGTKWDKSYEKINKFESQFHWVLNNKESKRNKKTFEMVTLSVFPDMKETVKEYKDLLNAHSLLSDLSSKIESFNEDLSADIPYATWALYSPKNSQNKKGEVMIYKLLKYEDTMYLMIKMWRGRSWNPKKKPRISDQLVDKWVDIFKGEWLDDSENKDQLIQVVN